MVQALEADAPRKTVVEVGTDGRYVSTGHLIYGFDGALHAVPFDLQQLEATGPPTAVVEDVRWAGGRTSGGYHYSTSDTGSLIITRPTFEFGNPLVVPRPFTPGGPNMPTMYDVAPDGRFIGLVPQGQSAAFTRSRRIYGSYSTGSTSSGRRCRVQDGSQSPGQAQGCDSGQRLQPRASPPATPINAGLFPAR